MKGCKLIIVVFSMLLIACSSSSSKYNGFKGYKLNNKDQQSVSITYIDERINGYDDIVKKAKDTCSYLLKASQSDINFIIYDRREYIKDVNFNVALPSVNVGSISSGPDGLVMNGPSTSYNSEKIIRAISFFEVSIKCSIK